MAYNPKTGKGLGRFYSAEHRAFRAREWRGFRDTFYDFFRWLYLYGFMAAKLGCHPILMVKAMLRYRWMVSYLTAAHMVDRHTMGLRGKELRYAHNQFFSVLHNSVLGVRDIILSDKNLRPNSKHAAKLRENTVMFDEMTPHLIMMGFPTVKWIDIAMFAIDWRMGLALLVTIPVALVPMAAGMRSYNKNYAAYMAANNHVNSVIVEYVEGIQVVKAFSQGERSYAKFAQAVGSFRDFTLNWFRCTWASMNLCLSILPTTLLGTLPVGVYLYQTGVLDPAQVTLCLMMALGIVSPLMSATAFINSMKSMQFAVKDTRELLDLPQLSQARQEAKLDGSGIRFRNVSFSYGGTEDTEVLHDLELHIPQGSFTALVGPSGGGKSTIARLAARFWDVTAGSITLGGRDIREMPLKQLSQAISFVTQDNFLFDCSLKENIRLGKPDASDEEVLAAARAAQCEEFLARLDRGWDTPAGEAGKQLSGGERQRIAIARAILKDAPIVILDEATAFTDPENEDKIQSSIMALSKGKTLLVIAHRLSTIQNADQIVVLEKGHIVDQGTQAELLRRCPLYQKLWQAHIGAQGWAVTSGAKEGQ